MGAEPVSESYPSAKPSNVHIYIYCIYTVYILERVDTIVFQIFRGKIPQLSPGRSAGSLPGLRCVDFRPIEVAGFFPSKKWDSKGDFTIL